jgi:L-alanine-DL-glutamate epimerase-like enolase superfamily enzyme
VTITGARIGAYSAAYDRPITNGLYTYTATEIVICELRTSSGATGVGWAHGGLIVFQAMKEIAETIIGLDEADTERIWHTMYRPKLWGRRGLATRAISAIDIAVWDCIGRQTSLSVAKLLGGFAPKVPAYMAGGYYGEGKGLDQLQEEMAAQVAIGARAIKMKIGAVPIPEDVERIDAAREAVGPDVRILVDANNAYSRIDAEKMVRKLEERDIYWFEEPLSPDDLDGAAALARGTDIPIALGENEYTRFGFKDVIDKGAADVVNADAQILGGITEWRKCATIAEVGHIPVAPHGDQEIHVHLVAAVPNGLIVEYYDNSLNTLKEVMFEQSLQLDEDGCLSPPDRPGLGFDIDFDALKPFSVAAETL